MTNEAIEAAARAIAELCEVHDNWQDCIPEARDFGHLKEGWDQP